MDNSLDWESISKQLDDLKILLGKSKTSNDENNDDLVRFVSIYSEVFEVFFHKNAKYQNSWKNDGLDVRAIWAEINAKYRRGKTLIWDQFDEMDKELVYEVLRDTILYCMFAMRRIELEKGKIDMERVRRITGLDEDKI